VPDNRFVADSIPRPAGKKQAADKEVNGCRFTIHAGDRSGNSAAIREEPSGLTHGIAQLGSIS
jgi:hypothetical protein